MKLYRVYGSGTIEAVKENPYRLVEDIFGVGFKKADKIADRMGVARDDEFRIKSGVKFTLSYFAGEGNTFLPQDMLCEKAGQLLDLPIELIGEQLIDMAF
ncbi:MAG: helix-hairpin-helix domain-containing protein, partial [Clostridia bacterium]